MILPPFSPASRAQLCEFTGAEAPLGGVGTRAVRGKADLLNLSQLNLLLPRNLAPLLLLILLLIEENARFDPLERLSTVPPFLDLLRRLFEREGRLGLRADG